MSNPPFDIHLALPYIKIDKGIFHLNYFPHKCNFGELESFHNEVFNSSRKKKAIIADMLMSTFKYTEN